MPAAVIVDHRDLIVTKAIDMVFINKEAGVIDQELSDFVFPIREHQAAGMTLIGKVQTVVIVAVKGTIKKVNALVVTVKTASMVIDHIENDGQTIQVANINQDLELIHLSL